MLVAVLARSSLGGRDGEKRLGLIARVEEGAVRRGDGRILAGHEELDPLYEVIGLHRMGHGADSNEDAIGPGLDYGDVFFLCSVG